MAHGFYRGQAAQYNIFGRNLTDYLRGLGEGQFQDLLKTLYKSQRPLLGEAVEKFGHQAAGLGQAVPGQGFSGAAQKGEREIFENFMADITGQALQAYELPWAGLFGSTAQIPGLLMGTKSAPTASEQLQQPFAGMSCCFIMTEGNDGVLDMVARKYRNEHGTETMRSGYVWLANRLVPQMRQSKIVKNLIRWTMVKPLIWSGKAFYRENFWGFTFWTLGIAWLLIFDFIGRIKQNEFPKRALFAPAV